MNTIAENVAQIEHWLDTHPNEIIDVIAWHEDRLVELLSHDIDETLDFLLNECTANQFSWIIGIFDILVEKTQSRRLVAAARELVKNIQLNLKNMRSTSIFLGQRNTFIHERHGFSSCSRFIAETT